MLIAASGDWRQHLSKKAGSGIAKSISIVASASGIMARENVASKKKQWRM